MENLSTKWSIAISTAGLVAALSTAAPAQANIFGLNAVKQWNMCDWENIPDNVLDRISDRNDFDDILRRMFDQCPDSALGFTDRPTASVSDTDDDDQRGREPDEPDAPTDTPDEHETPDEPETPDVPETPEVPDYGLPA